MFAGGTCTGIRDTPGPVPTRSRLRNGLKLRNGTVVILSAKSSSAFVNLLLNRVIRFTCCRDSPQALFGSIPVDMPENEILMYAIVSYICSTLLVKTTVSPVT